MIDVDRRAGLNQAKMDSLLRETFPDSQFEPIQTKIGAMRSNGTQKFLYAPNENVSPLAISLALATDETDINLVVDASDHLLLEQTMGLATKHRLWVVEGNKLVPHPELKLEERHAPQPLNPTIASLLETNGCEIVQENGMTKGEIKGLEVARVVEGSEGESALQVGVGIYDQEAHKLVDGNESTEEKLSRVVSEVLHYRNKQARPHPLNRVSRPKWLISELVNSPENSGLEEVRRLPVATESKAITETTPAAALARAENTKVLIVASVGVDLNAIPIASGLSVSTQADEIWMIQSERDKYPVLERQAKHLKVPHRFLKTEEPWPS